MEKQCFI